MDDHLLEALRLLQDARDHIVGFIGSSYSETGKDDEAFVDEIDRFLGNTPQAQAIFRARYNGEPNPLTPVVVDYTMRCSGKYAIELSRSHDGDLWGVTVLTADGSNSDLSKGFSTWEEADDYLSTFRSKK